MMWRRKPDAVVGVPVVERSGQAWRVSAPVDGTEVWFESDELELAPSPEALISAFLIPSLGAGRRLVSSAPLAGDFASHLPPAMALVHRWWKYPLLKPLIPAVPAPARAIVADDVALCFSGGIDSFHSLLRGHRKPGLLVFVHGFDVQLDDAGRAGQMLKMTRQVAKSTGARACVVRTNLRRHPLMVSERWERDHGGALAAIGHLLSNSIGHLVISSSYARVLGRPLGSHWDLDPLWSGAGLTVEHYGEEFLRREKVWDIAGEPLVQEHLRVCWRHPNQLPNCSRCGKCVRTRILLSAAGALNDYALLEGDATLAESIDALPPTGHARSIHQYRAAIARGLPPDVDAALRRLIARSRGQVVLERTGISGLARKAGSLSRRVAARARRSLIPEA